MIISSAMTIGEQVKTRVSLTIIQLPAVEFPVTAVFLILILYATLLSVLCISLLLIFWATIIRSKRGFLESM